MAATENEHLEFKEARTSFDAEKLVKYCCALANERGGRLILGVSDARPRQVVGTNAFGNIEDTKASLVDRLRLRIEVDEIAHPHGRVLVFDVPSRPVGVPMQVQGAYWMRAGESLVAMTPDLLQRIFAEGQPDFSAQKCPGAAVSDLDPRAVDAFRRAWIARRRRPELAETPAGELLEDAELLVDGQVTYAALVLLGSSRALGKHLPQAEVVFEYRGDSSSIAYQQRVELREGFLLIHDELWRTINLRNDVFSYQEGLFRYDVPAFGEAAVREAILNAIAHRDYRLAGSVFVKQSPTSIEITSPGGLPPEITVENIMYRQSPRNRRIAEALEKCGLVERSGQGVDRMFESALRAAKDPPDFSRTDGDHVVVVLDGRVRDEAFLRFLDRLRRERNEDLRLVDLLVLDAVHRDRPIPPRLLERVEDLIAAGALERAARKRLVLSRRFYELTGRAGEYTRRRGLDHATRKELLFKHIRESGPSGAPITELEQVLPDASRNQVKTLLRGLKAEGRIAVRGARRGSRWVALPLGGSVP